VVLGGAGSLCGCVGPRDQPDHLRKAYLRYRQRGGARGAPLPDFYIGAHAALSDLALLTRDARRYRSYFPRLALIAP
jgi:predicted nucleic acid-binding protein